MTGVAFALFANGMTGGNLAPERPPPLSPVDLAKNI